MAGFSYRKNLDGSAYVPSTLDRIGANSVVFSVGDLVRINTSGFVDICDTTEGIAGVLTTVTDKNGKPVSTDSGTLDTWTMNSANQTSASYQYRVHFIPALPNYLFYNDADASLAASNEFATFTCNDENDVDVATTANDNTLQVKLIERDPDHDGDASKGLWQINLSQFEQTSATRAS